MADIVDVLLKAAPHLGGTAKASANYVMIQCPFHASGTERTPSCSVSRTKPVFFCHGCGESGHVSRLLRHFGMSKATIDLFVSSSSFAETRRRAAAKERQGDYVSNPTKPTSNPYKGLFVLDEDILDAYRTTPLSLAQDGYEERTLRHFEVGWDSVNMRITYPIRDYYGSLVGVSGRRMYGEGAKYKLYDKELVQRSDANVPEDYTMDAVKRGVLWHMHTVWSYLWDAGEPILIVEGFKACMWTWQAGYKSVVATMGTYLTKHHVELIARAGVPVYLFLDNNKAGWSGTYKASLQLVRKADFYIVRYPDEREQPDSLEPEEVTEAIRNSQRFLEWRREHDFHEAAFAVRRSPDGGERKAG